MNRAAAIEINGASKTYPGSDRPAVDNLSLTIPAGRIFGLLGPNGAGKTTLLSMVSGLLEPDRGELRVAGAPSGSERARGALGLVPQDLAIYPSLSARENLEFFGHMQGLRGARLETRIAACLELAGLAGLAHRRTGTFSGGLKRRLNLAIGLIHEPRLLILDEPTVGIDPQSRHHIRETLARLNREGMSIVYTTHYMEEVESLCHELAIIDQGRIIAQGAMDELLTRYQAGHIEARTRTPAGIAPAGISLDARLACLPGVRRHAITDHVLSLESDRPQESLQALLALLAEHGVEVASVSMGAMNLEQVFLLLTGTRLRN